MLQSECWKVEKLHCNVQFWAYQWRWEVFQKKRNTSDHECTTTTLGNFTKAPLDAISKTYNYVILDLWKETMFTKSSYQKFMDKIVTMLTHVTVHKIQAPAVATSFFLHKDHKAICALERKA